MHIPRATYRIQFSPSFGFRDAAAILPYLADLGISDIYASPIFKARKGSAHGYDIVDPNALNDELGTPQEFEDLVRQARSKGLSWLQDIVPNHMAFDRDNETLMTLLENGRRSSCARYFDIDWEHPSESIRGKILAPFLGGFYSECLENGEIQLHLDAKGLSINYYDLRLPLRIESYHLFFAHGLETLEARLGESDPDFIKYLGAIHSLPRKADDFASQGSQVRYVKDLIWHLHENNPLIREFLGQTLELFNGTPGDPRSFDLLDALLSEQNFRLSFWKFANEEINYRRFFTINELISVRIEDQKIFEETHKLAFRFMDEGKIDGLRVDHVDGLYDPSGYLERLRKKQPDSYIVVEKILGHGEEIPLQWPVQGTTGYEFLNHLNGVFVDGRHEAGFESFYSEITGGQIPYRKTLLDKKRLISGKHLAGNIDNLARYLKNISSRDRYGRDITLYGLKRALVEVMAHFPIYRTYINFEGCRPCGPDYIRFAVKDALVENPGLMYELRFIERFMLMAVDQDLSAEERAQAVEFVMQFQQLTGPLMAKGFEDTFFYVYNRFISLNEVGGHPDRFGIPVTGFHEFNVKRAQSFPHSLLATSTHDTKRGEDVRARLNVLSELPEEWQNCVRTWKTQNLGKKNAVRGNPAPDSNDEYFFYQTLIGAFPFALEELPEFSARIKAYIIKAVREAKVHTDWLKPDTEYEEAYTAFVEKVLDRVEENPFLTSFLPFQKKVAHFGMLNSLSQALLKITAPGVPDIYQGTELWDLHLVDPDNRRPVDFGKRMSILTPLRGTAKSLQDLIGELLEKKEDGRVKLFLIMRALLTRKQNPGLFENGSYLPLECSGSFKGHVISFARKYLTGWTLVIVPRCCVSLLKDREILPLGGDIWQDTTVHLPEDAPRNWVNAFSGEKLEERNILRVGQALTVFPAALLTGKEG